MPVVHSCLHLGAMDSGIITSTYRTNPLPTLSFTNLDCYIFPVIIHKDMTGIKDALQAIVGSVGSANQKAENSGSALLDRLGDKVFGPTAESETKNAPIIAPEASTMPVTQGRRSLRPDGQDPFRGGAAVPANES